MYAFSSLSLALPSRTVGAFGRHPSFCARSKPRTSLTMVADPHSTHQAVHVALSHLLASVPVDHHPLQSISHLLADAAATVSDTVSAASSVASDAASAASDAAEATTEAAKSATGPWKLFVNLIESCITSLHNLLASFGIPGAYGLSIISFTLIVKALTFPLNFRQMESTMKMQALAPRLRKLQTDYKDNPAVLNQMTADLYKNADVNPLAGCLPVFAQIPIWIALYRSVLNLASDNLLNESFLWLPSLQGPVSKTGQGLDTWLFPLVDGAPPIGWHDAICYLTLPVILIVSQFYSQRVISQSSNDPQQQQTNALLKFMPFLVGWFSLNVPSGLGIYWITNNLVTTLQTVYIRSKFPQLAAQANTSADNISNEEYNSGDMAPNDGFRSSASSTSSSPPKASKNKKRRKRR